MKKKNSMMITGLYILAVAVSLAGCGSQDGKKEKEALKKPAVCFLIANTANSQGINFNSPLVQDTVLECANNYGFIAVINADGNSEVLVGESLDIDEKYKKASPERLEMDARNKATNILGVMETVIADDPEIDYLEALRLACRTMSSLEGYTSKTIIVLGTGLSTTGYMNFSNNLILAEPETVADILEDKKAIPDFSGITSVCWQGMADTAAPQEALSPMQRSNLQDIWSAVIDRGNGKLVPNDFISNPADTNTEYPPVTLVDLPIETPVKFEAEAFKKEENAFEVPVMLSEEQVTFVGDKSEYLNPEEAVETIKPIAEYLNQHEQVNILLAGTTAGDEDNEYTFKLSKERAEAVRKTLIGLGVDEGRILTVGLASSDPWHISNVGDEGTMAAQNRKVVLLDSSTELAQEILKQ